MQTQLMIIGGGASGLAAAVAAKQIAPDIEVCVIERNARVGKKILATGNGRCNLGNSSSNRTAYYGTLTKLLPEIWEKTFDTELFFQEMGLYCRHESEGRLYPRSNHASSVLDTIRLTAELLQVKLWCDCTITELQKEGNQFVAVTSTDKFIASAVILAIGGLAAPKTGSDGTGFSFLKPLGHCISMVKPALVPFYTEPSLIRPLKGIRIFASVTAWNKNKKLCTETGEVQFTTHALSGICVMNLSARCFQTEPDMLSCNLFPEDTEEQVLSLLWEVFAVRAQWKLEDWLSGLFPKKVGMQLLRTAGISLPFDALVHCITPFEVEKLAVLCQNWRFPVLSRGSWQEAQVTSGGIPLEEIDYTLQSRTTPGLFFAGEMLDLHGDCGGYNLDWAWHSGQYAAQNAIQFLHERNGHND